jgi:hypothetical protein
LRGAERLREHLGDLRRDVLDQHRAQRAVVAQYFAHPQRRPPRKLRDGGVESADERRDERAPIAAGREQAFAQRADDGQHALGDERLEQLVLAAEVVVDEGGGHAGFDGDAAQAGGGDAVRREAGDRRVEQPLALVGFVGLGARPAGAAGLGARAGFLSRRAHGV